VKDIIIF